jgi:hypothetical protein
MKKVSDLEKRLFRDGLNTKRDNKNIQYYLEQYKTYLGMLDKISDRRQQANEFFLALNTALLGFLGYTQSQQEPSTLLFVVASVVGICLSYFWYAIIKSYRELNAVKFKVVQAIEQRLPIALFDTEWEIIGRREDKTTYSPFTYIEIRVPWVLSVLYVGILIYSIFSK